ncbi:MAG: hypothetical protein AB7U29_07495 [Desulfobulbus sp.]
MRNIWILLLVIIALMPRVSGAMEKAAQAGFVPQQQTMIRQMVGLGLTEGVADALASAMIKAQFTGDEAKQIIGQLHLVENDREALAAIAGKVHEGIAKRATANAIIHAVTRVRERQALAKATAQSLAAQHQKELSPIVADALVSGLRQTEVGQISQGLRARIQGLGKEDAFRLTMETMMTVRDMVRYGVPPTTATSVAVKALSQGYGVEDMNMLRRLVNDQRMQTDMGAVSQRILQGLNKGIRSGEMRGFALGAQNGSAGSRGGNGSGGSGGGGGSGHGGSGGHGGGGHGGGR